LCEEPPANALFLPSGTFLRSSCFKIIRCCCEFDIFVDINHVMLRTICRRVSAVRFGKPESSIRRYVPSLIKMIIWFLFLLPFTYCASWSLSTAVPDRRSLFSTNTSSKHHNHTLIHETSTKPHPSNTESAFECTRPGSLGARCVTINKPLKLEMGGQLESVSILWEEWGDERVR
jgi:hypothetical protein